MVCLNCTCTLTLTPQIVHGIETDPNDVPQQQYLTNRSPTNGEAQSRENAQNPLHQPDSNLVLQSAQSQNMLIILMNNSLMMQKLLTLNSLTAWIFLGDQDDKKILFSSIVRYFQRYFQLFYI
jgi:hypothetical protein